MRSDLNLVTNSVDVINYDVEGIKNKYEAIKKQLTDVTEITQEIEKDVDALKFRANIQMVGSLVGMGIKIGPKLISFASGAISAISNALKVTKTGVDVIRAADRALYALRSSTIELPTIIDWCDENDEQLQSLTFTEEEDNPDTSCPSLNATYQLAYQVRNTVKPVIKSICEKMLEFEENLNNIDITDQIDTKIQEVNNKINEKISKSDLVRNDKVDMFANVENHELNIRFEDSVENGLIVFKTLQKMKIKKDKEDFILKLKIQI